MNQIPGFPQKKFPGGGLIRTAVLVDPLGADHDRTVLRPENSGAADAQRNNGIGLGNTSFRKENAVVFVEGNDSRILGFKGQMNAVRQAFRIVFGVHGPGVYMDDGLVILPCFAGQSFQDGTAGPGHQREPCGSRRPIRPGFCEQTLAVTEALGHPSGFPVSEFPVPGIMALAAPQNRILQAAADIGVLPEPKIILHFVDHGGRHRMNMRIGDGSDAAAAAGPADGTERRDFDG